MSEWKWCGYCDHRYDAHELVEGVFMGCTIVNDTTGPDGCQCEQMYFVDTP